MTTIPAVSLAAPVTGISDIKAIVYRLFDVGYAIDLEAALEPLKEDRAQRIRLARGEAQAIQIPNPPITLALGREVIRVAGREHHAEVSARIFDFGAVSLRVEIDGTSDGWAQHCAFGDGVHALDLAPLFASHLERLLARIGRAIERPAVAPVTEDYVVFRLGRLPASGGDGVAGSAAAAAASLSEEDIVRLLLNETRPLSPDARRELLPHRFSYYEDDLAIVSWNTALVLEPVAGDTDVQYVLEFANAQLLQLRLFDAQLDAELPRVYDRVERARARSTLLFRRYAPLLVKLQTLVADSTELMERVENSLKVTDDVYLARIYSAALEVFRWRVWRSGIDRKLTILRETYEMLNGESQATRAEALEFMIVLLIVTEIVLSFVMG